MENLFSFCRGFPTHREKSNPYFSSDEDFLKQEKEEVDLQESE